MVLAMLLTTLALMPIGYPISGVAKTGAAKTGAAKTGPAKFLSLLRTQFVAADPGMLSSSMNQGTGASKWGIWRKDPGLWQSLPTSYLLKWPTNASLHSLSFMFLSAPQCIRIVIGWQFIRTWEWVSRFLPYPVPKDLGECSSANKFHKHWTFWWRQK